MGEGEAASEAEGEANEEGEGSGDLGVKLMVWPASLKLMIKLKPLTVFTGSVCSPKPGDVTKILCAPGEIGSLETGVKPFGTSSMFKLMLSGSEITER